MSLDALIRERSIVLCCGTGGVGKTTTAAALAVEAARTGRRSVVVTIDPAKRLADALGLDGLGNDPRPVIGPWGDDRLFAAMLDTRATFDAIVTRHAADDAQRDRILANGFYRNISGSLSGTQEYMAMEKLYELHEEGGFDLVVVDTPPASHALDFLDAPRRLTRFLDHRLYRALTAPNRGPLRAVNLAAQSFVRTVAKVVGAEVIDDAIAFFQAFDGMEAGFRARAARVLELLDAPATGYVLVTAPRPDLVTEARSFAARLLASGLRVDALIVNRMHPDVGNDVVAARQVAERERAAGRDAPADQWTTLAELREVTSHEAAEVDRLAEALPGISRTLVPLLDVDVHDLDGLATIGSHLFGPGR